MFASKGKYTEAAILETKGTRGGYGIKGTAQSIVCVNVILKTKTKEQKY